MQCPEVNKQWQALEKWCKYFITSELKISPKCNILNNYHGKNDKLVNTVVLALKRYVYVAKCQEKMLNFQEFIRYLMYIKKIEY